MSSGDAASTTHGLTGSHQSTLVGVWIEAISGPGQGARVELQRGTLLLGSGPACELVLEDPSVSRRHAVAELVPGAVVVRDAGSRNGTFYLGARITEARIPIGGQLRLGRTVVVFRLARQEQLPPSSRVELAGVIGHSEAMRRLFTSLERLAATRLPVLIEGETGVGKEAVARALHQLSEGAAAPLAVFDCAAVSANLIEAKLFGHGKGAFTGAAQATPGILECEGGTLLLDSIDELPLELQPRLLRVLDTGEFHRVGEHEPRHLRARVIATSRASLEAEVAAGRFRADLFFRISAARLHVPPLRARPEDIEPLALHFARRLKGPEFRLSSSMHAALHAHTWPGNARELRNTVERMLVLDGGAMSAQPEAEGALWAARDQVVQHFERDFLAGLLQRHGNNVSSAAREAGIARSQFYRMLERYKLRGPGDRSKK